MPPDVDVTEVASSGDARGTVRQTARVVLCAFLLTFIATRVLVLSIMTRRIPDLYLYLGGTHIHHLNYGIFLLAGVGAYFLFVAPSSQSLRRAGIIYGVGLALTFDEFGMWLHLGGGYWQRASFDAVIVLAGVLGLLSFAPRLERGRSSRVATLLVIAAALVFAVYLVESFRVANRVQPRLQRLESGGPP